MWKRLMVMTDDLTSLRRLSALVDAFLLLLLVVVVLFSEIPWRRPLYSSEFVEVADLFRLWRMQAYSIARSGERFCLRLFLMARRHHSARPISGRTGKANAYER